MRKVGLIQAENGTVDQQAEHGKTGILGPGPCSLYSVPALFRVLLVTALQHWIYDL